MAGISLRRPEETEHGAAVLSALERYKARDTSKGANLKTSQVADYLNLLHSRRSIQSRRKCAHHEAELLQNHRVEPLSDGDPIFTEGAWLEKWRCIGTLLFCLLGTFA